MQLVFQRARLAVIEHPRSSEKTRSAAAAELEVGMIASRYMTVTKVLTCLLSLCFLQNCEALLLVLVICVLFVPLGWSWLFVLAFLFLWRPRFLFVRCHKIRNIDRLIKLIKNLICFRIYTGIPRASQEFDRQFWSKFEGKGPGREGGKAGKQLSCNLQVTNKLQPTFNTQCVRMRTNLPCVYIVVAALREI